MVAAGAVVPCALLIWFFQHVCAPVPRMLLACGTVAGAVAAAWVWQHELLVRRRRSLSAAMLLSGGLAVAAGVLWNQGFVRYSPDALHRGIFRASLQRFWTPCYGVPQYTSFHRGWPAMAVGGAAVALVFAARGERMTALRLFIILGLQTAAVLTFAASEGHLRLAGHAWEFQPFVADAQLFHGPADLLARYVAMMPSLSWFGCHYPPGSALLFMAQAAIGDAFPLAFYAITASAVGATAAVYFAACELAPARPRVAYFATLAYATATGPLVFASLSTTPLVLLPAAVAIWALLRAARTGGFWPAVILGWCVVAFGAVSLSVGFFGVVLAAVAALAVRSRPHVLRTCAVAGAVVVTCVLSIKALTGFNFVQCARVGFERHRWQIHAGEYEGWQPLFIRSSGNVLAFVLGNLPIAGVCVAAVLLWRTSDWRRPRNMMLPASLVAIAAATLSGNFVLETERIWLFLIPPLALAAAVELARYRRGREPRWAIAAMIAFALTQELGFIHWR